MNLGIVRVKPALNHQVAYPPNQNCWRAAPAPGYAFAARLGAEINPDFRSAGYGKTTLLGEWLATCGQTTAWVSLDKGDNDPARFWAYVIAALRSIFSSADKTLPDILISSHPSPGDDLITELINELDKLPQPLILVLDDYHMSPVKKG